VFVCVCVCLRVCAILKTSVCVCVCVSLSLSFNRPPPTRTILMSNDFFSSSHLLSGEGEAQSNNERSGERTGIRGKRIDTLFLGSRVATTRTEIV